MERIVSATAGLLAASLWVAPSALAQIGVDQEPTVQPTGANAFNPAISLVLMGQYADYSGRDDQEFELPGFQLGGEAGLPEEGFGLDHTELTISANIDPYWFGQVTAALASHEGETELELEEAFAENSALPGGLGLTVGRFLSGVGYLNSRHRHSWDFVDAPLPQQAFLGGNYYDDGIRLTWLAPTPLFLEIAAEAFRGGRFPAAHEGSGIGAYTASAHIGGDVGVDHSWQAGISRLWSEPEGRAAGGHAHEDDEAEPEAAFTGRSSLTILDAVWKWTPAGNGRGTSLALQGEYFDRHERGVISHEHDLEATNYDGKQRGFYTQAVYQFQPRWRAGLRYDRLWSDNRAADAELLEETGWPDADGALERYSAMLDFSTSEFSRLRLQYTRDDVLGEPQHQWFLQYVMSLGAHGAHRF